MGGRAAADSKSPTIRPALPSPCAGGAVLAKGALCGEESLLPIAAGLKFTEAHLDAIKQSHERCAALSVSRIGVADRTPLGRDHA